MKIDSKISLIRIVMSLMGLIIIVSDWLMESVNIDHHSVCKMERMAVTE